MFFQKTPITSNPLLIFLISEYNLLLLKYQCRIRKKAVEIYEITIEIKKINESTASIVSSINPEAKTKNPLIYELIKNKQNNLLKKAVRFFVR